MITRALLSTEWSFGEPVMKGLPQSGNVALIGKSLEPDAAIKLITRHRPQFVIHGADATMDEWEHVLWNSGKVSKGLVTILTTTTSSAVYRRLCHWVGADYTLELPSEMMEFISTGAEMAASYDTH